MTAMYDTPFEGARGGVNDTPEDMYEMYDSNAARFSRQQRYQEDIGEENKAKIEEPKTVNNGFSAVKFGTIVFLMLLSLSVSSFSLILMIMQNGGSPMGTDGNNTVVHGKLQNNVTNLLVSSLEQLTIRTSNISAALELLEKTMSGTVTPAKCSEVVYNGQQGWVRIFPLKSVGDFTPYIVPCPWDGYIVIQRYLRRSLDFDRNWEKYARGFGDRSDEFWLGLREIHALTASGNYQLRINVRSEDGPIKRANYGTFRISNESDGFRLTASEYSGRAGDLLANRTVHRFTTKDKDQNDDDGLNCAEIYSIGFWFNACNDSSSPGLYGAKFPNIILFEMKIRSA